MANLTPGQIEQLWIQAGGDPNLAPTMAAIALAESNGNPDAYNGSDTNGQGGTQVSAGLWQISTGTMSPIDNWSDPLANAKAAVQKYQSQGLGAWGTYYTGAYKNYLAQVGANVSDTSTVGGTAVDTNTASDPAVQQYLQARYEASQGPNGPNANQLPFASAYATLSQELTSWGLGGLAGWAWDELANGTSPDQIMIDMEKQPTWQNSIIGQVTLAQRAAGLPVSDASTILSYRATADQLARNANLPAGFMTDAEVVKLMGSGVSTTELTDRINNGYAAAMNAPQETRNLLSQYFGVNTGDLAAYFLDPTKAEDLLSKQLLAANIGEEGVASGFGDIGAQQATQLAQQFTAEGKSTADAQSVFKTLAPLTGLETALPGQGGSMPTVSQADLLGYGFSGANQTEVERALSARKAPFSGGGGYLAGSKGVLGAGSASETGVTGT